jgi:outer membrane immunogenic protein
MRKLLAVAIVSVPLISGSALAADMPVKAPPAPAVAEWTGFYVGVHVGGALTHGGVGNSSDPLFTGPYAPLAAGTTGKGAVGGGQVGFNWQVAPNWVIGVEGDGSWTDLSASGAGVPVVVPGFGLVGPIPGARILFKSDVDWMASVRGRLGYLWGNSLLYATGGYAWGGFKDSATFTFRCQNPPCQSVVATGGAPSKTDSAFVVGGGAQWKAPGSRWSLGVEYLYYGFHDTRGFTGAETDPATGAQLRFGLCAVGVPCNVQFAVRDPGIHVARIRLDYSLGDPLVAKY